MGGTGGTGSRVPSPEAVNSLGASPHPVELSESRQSKESKGPEDVGNPPRGPRPESAQTDEEKRLTHSDLTLEIPYQMLYTFMFDDYVEHLDANPRRVIRLLNSYRVHVKMLFQLCSNEAISPSCLDRRLIRRVMQWTILCELCPVRVAFLLHCASSLRSLSEYCQNPDEVAITEFAELTIFRLRRGTKGLSLHELVSRRPLPRLPIVSHNAQGPRPVGDTSDLVYELEHSTKTFNAILENGDDARLYLKCLYNLTDGPGRNKINLSTVTTNLNPAAHALVESLLQHGKVGIEMHEARRTQVDVAATDEVVTGSPTLDQTSYRRRTLVQTHSTTPDVNNALEEERELLVHGTVEDVRDPATQIGEDRLDHRVSARRDREGWADSTGGPDKLDYDVSVRVLVDAIISADPPRRIGLYSPWGKGKSFVFNKIDCYLKARSIKLNCIWNSQTSSFTTNQVIKKLLEDSSKMEYISIAKLHDQTTKWCQGSSEQLTQKLEELRASNSNLWTRKRVVTRGQYRCTMNCGFYIFELYLLLGELVLLFFVLPARTFLGCVSSKLIPRGVPEESKVKAAESRNSSFYPEECDFWCVSFNAWEHENARSIDAALVATIAKAVENRYGSIYSDAYLRAELWMYSLLLVLLCGVASGVIFALVSHIPETTDARTVSVVVAAIITLGGVLATLWRLCSPIAPVSEEIRRQHDRGGDVEAQLGFSNEVLGKLQELDDILDKPENMKTAWDLVLPSFLKDKLNLLYYMKIPRIEHFRQSRVVILVDDLDRCNKSVALNIFRTCNALITEKLNSFIICFAMDPSLIAESIAADESHSFSQNGYRYLEKIINLPFSLPSFDKENLSKLISDQVVGIEAKREYLNKISQYNDVADKGRIGVFNDGQATELDLSNLLKHGLKLDMKSITKFLEQDPPNVKVVRLQKSGVEKDEIRLLANSIEHNRSLEVLEIDEGKLDTSARSLAIYRRNLFEEVVLLVVKFLLQRRSPMLSVLYLRNNKIGAEGANAIGDALKKNESLKELYLESTEIGGDASAIATALKSNSALTTLSLDYNRIGDSGGSAIGQALESNRTLVTLRLVKNGIGNSGASAIGQALVRNSSLTWLSLDDNGIGDDGASVIGQALQSNSALTWLSLGSNKIGAGGAGGIRTGLSQNESLKTLLLSANEIGDEGAVEIRGVLVENKSLEELYLDKNKLGPLGAEAIRRGLAKNESLEQLYLMWNQFGDAGAIAIAKGLRENKALTTLNLNSNKVGAEGARRIGGALVKNKSLKTLYLERNRIGDGGASAIGQGLKFNSALLTLCLERNGIGDGGASALGDALLSNSALMTLSLSINQIAVDGVVAISKGLVENKSLKELYLRRNEIGDQGAKAIGDGLAKNESLKTLYLWENNLSEESKTQIRQAWGGRSSYLFL